MTHKLRLMPLLLLLACAASGATRLVPSQYATIQLAANAAAAGDTVLVSLGTFDERVTVPSSGSEAGGYINFVGSPNTTGTGVVMRGFTITDKHHIRIVGFEITHANSANRAAVYMQGTVSNVMILDNYIHDTEQEGIFAQNNGTVSQITIRGNVFYYIAHPGSLAAGNTAIANAFVTPFKWLVEYNRCRRTVDFANVYGTNHVFRHNDNGDFRDAYWSAVGHPDFFQAGSDGVQAGSRHHVYERNFDGDRPTDQCHFALFQDSPGAAGDTNMLVRGNVVYDIGNGGVGMISTDKLQMYANTWHEMCKSNSGSIVLNAYRTTAQSGGSVGGLLINTIISEMRTPSPAASANIAIFVETNGNVFTVSNNLGYSSGADPSFASTSDPLYVDKANHDFRLQAGSPARGLGTNVTWITNANGSGTSFGVPDSHRLYDGWGMVEGDVIVTGGTTTRIVSVDLANNVVTVASSVTWTNNQPVYWGRFGDQKDVGGYPYGAEFLTGGSYSRNGNAYTITPSGHARFAWVYVDGVPKTKVYDPIGGPWTVNEAGNVTAVKLYAEWAQEYPVRAAVEQGGGEPVSGTPLKKRGSMKLRAR